MNPIRQLAKALGRHARFIMPADRAFWAEALRNELAHIDDDGAALRWAFGGVMTSYLERATSLFASTPTRALLVLPTLFVATQDAFAQLMTLAWRLHATGYLEFAGAITPGDDYRRFIPLMDAMPAWYLVGGFVAGLLTVAAAIQLLLRGRSATLLFIAGVAIAGLAEACIHLVPGYDPAMRQVFHFQNVNPMRDLVIPIAAQLLPICLAGAIWLAARGEDRGGRGSAAAG